MVETPCGFDSRLVDQSNRSNAGLAQQEEYLICNQVVRGSIPLAGSIFNNRLAITLET